MTKERSTRKSWDMYRRNLNVLATGTGTLSKRPRFEPEEPCYIARGKGCRVWDVDGNEYIDFRNALGPITLGYRFPAIDDAIRRQLEKGILFCHPSPLEGEVAELVVAMVPCAEKVRYLKTGGEALAAAIKAARALTGRDLVLQCGYNGWLNTLAASGSVLPNGTRAAPVGVPQALAQLHRAMPWADMAPWEEAFAQSGDAVACAVVATDYAHPEKAREFLPALRELTARHGAKLITDEIVMGFRVAVGGIHDYAGVDVDGAVFSKGIANGMPVSVIAGKADLMDQFEQAVVSSTFSGEALSLAAAKASLTTYRDNDVVGHLAMMGKRWMNGINALFEAHDIPLASVGMPACSTFVAREGADAEGVQAALDGLFRAAYAHGVSLYSVCYTTFSFTESDIDEALGRIESGLSRK